MHRSKPIFYLITLLLFTAALLSGCNAPGGSEPAQPTVPALPTTAPTAIPTPEPTPEPRQLTICLGQEPSSLYLYASSTRSTWSVLEAVYDGPIDRVNYTSQPVILEKMPELSAGDAVLAPVTVQPGQVIVDADGALNTLQRGVKIITSGCKSPDCIVEWDGASAVEMDQLSLKFKLKEGITWSDGQPLTAADSEFSYQLAADPATPVSKDFIDRTASYHALDDRMIEWVGLPGFVTDRYDYAFFTPLPSHLYGSLSASEMLSNSDVNTKPLGWGPYIIENWEKNQSITLIKNPLYFRAGENLPYYDRLTYQIIGEQADLNIGALLTGTCDIVDQTAALDSQLEELVEQERAGKLTLYTAQNPEIEQLVFGIKPAEYDDGYFPYAGERPDFFGDAQVRKALTYCVNRQDILSDLMIDQTSIPVSFLPANSPLHAPNLPVLGYDPDEGKRLLDAAGWKDFDNDPATPRVAAGVATVVDGTPFIINYFTTTAGLRQEVAAKIAASLADCGVQVAVQAVTPDQLFAAGPGGSVFGRRFDLAQFSWQINTSMPCTFYQGSQVPSASNNWVGVNVGGYENAAFDSACSASRFSAVDTSGAAQQQLTAVQQIFAEELPAVPLFYRLNLALSLPGICGIVEDGSARSMLQGVESLSDTGGCP